MTTHKSIGTLPHRRKRAFEIPIPRGAFDYEYSDDELRALLPAVHQLADQAEETRVMFNVNRADQGVKGARLMEKLLRETVIEPALRAQPITR